MKSSLVCALGLVLAMVLGSFAQASTGLGGEEVAEKFVSPKVKGRLIWARSDDSHSTNPDTWSYLYFDPFAENNGRLVQVTNGAVRKIAEGLVELDKARLASYKEEEVIPLARIRVDSDKALSIVKDAANLSGVTITRVDYILKTDDNNNVPSWKLVIYAAKGHGSEVELGTARVSAITGQIFSLEINTDKLQ